MSDPRPSIIKKRLENVQRIIAFASGKGGVGKSCCSSAAALLLARQGLRTGLLDLDFQGATDHIILGIEPKLPQEKGGILPLKAPYDLSYMGITPFTGERGVALRGEAVTDAIRELLAVVVWGDLDLLVVDLPPGIGEAILDLARYVGRTEVVLVSTPSILSRMVMDRLVQVLRAGDVSIGGYLLNMSRNGTPVDTENGASSSNLRLLGEVPYIDNFDDLIGSPDRFLESAFGTAIATVLHSLLERERES